MSEQDTTSAAGKPAGRMGRGGRLAGLMVSALILGGVVVGVGFASSQLDERASSRPGPDPTPPTPVAGLEIALVDGYDAAASYAGRIEPARETALAFERAGLVIELSAEEGDRVAAGDPLARLDDRTLLAERARIEADIVRVDAEIALAERTLERQRRLEADGFASTQRFDEAETQLAANGAARAALSAQIEAIDLELEKTTIRAPFDGVVAERLLDPGAVVAPGTPAFRLIEADAPQARIGLPPEAAVGLSEGFEAPVESAGVVYVGRLSRLRPDLNADTRTVDAVFDLDIADGLPEPIFGAVARLEIARRVETAGAWVPLASLRAGSNGFWRLMTLEVADAAAAEGALLGDGGSAVVRDGGLRRVARIDVRLERVDGERAFVSGSIGDGLLIIAEGVNRVSPGQLVRLIAEDSNGGASLSPSVAAVD